MGCNDKNKFVTAEASSKASLRTKGAIDKFLNIIDENLFRKLNTKWSLDARSRFNIKGNLFSEENNKVVPNKAAFKIIDNSKGIFYQESSRALQTILDKDLSTITDSEKKELQSTVENILLETNSEDLGIKGGQSYVFLSEKDAERFSYLLDKDKGFPKEFKVTKQITKYQRDDNNPLVFNPYNEYVDYYYTKSNNNKKSNLYDIIDKATGEIIATKVRVLHVTKDSKADIADKYGVNFLPTKVFSADRSISFALYRQKPSKAKYVAQAKRYLYDALKFLNKQDSTLNINLDKIEEFLDAFPADMWDYINTTYSAEDSTNINASISLQNEIKFKLPKLGLLTEIEKTVGIPLQGVSFKNYDRSGGIEKLFKYSDIGGSWGSSITIDHTKMTEKQLKGAIRYYLNSKNYFKPSSVEENVRKYAEHRNIDYNELRELVFGDIDKALDNISYNTTGNSDSIELSKWRESIREYDWQMAELFSKPYIEFNKRVKFKINEKFKDERLSNDIPHLDYFFSGNFNWMNINFNNISGQYYKEDMESEAPVGVTSTIGGIMNPFEMKFYQKPKAGEHFLKEEEVFNRLAAIIHEPFHALHALSYGTPEELELRKAFNSLKNTAFGKEMMSQVFGDGYNGREISDNVLYKEFTAFTTQLMLYPKEWVTKTDLRSNDIYEFIEKVQNLQDKSYQEIVRTNEKIGSNETIVTEEEKIKLNFFEKLYNYLVNALNKITPLSKKFFNTIASSNLVTKTIIEDVFQETEESVTKTIKLPENVKNAKEEFLQKMEDLKSAINTLMQIDSTLFNPENINNFFQSEETYNQESGTQETKPLQQKTEGPKSTPAAPKTIKLLRDFIKSIGVVIKDVKTINVNGVKYDADGIAMLMQKLIQVVEGTEAQSLPEEAMHFAVAIIKQTNPKLYKKLMSEINNYQMLQDVFDTYGNDPDYQIDGKPDVIALKEEAIAKVLAQTIINNNENSSEKPEMIAKSQSWWMDIIDALRNLFIKSGFDKLSMDIISGKKIGTAADIREDENRFFLQKTKQEEVVNRIREVSDKITLQPVKNEAGGEDHKYFINGKQIINRVSTIIKTWYDILRSDKALNDSEYKKGVNTLKADKGTAGHKDKEHAMDIMTDENGRLKSKDELDAIFANDNHVSFIDDNNNDMYILLRNNLRQRMESFPKDTVFMSEITIYDAERNLAGTVDFLAITPEGKVNILDWKFVGLNVERYKDIPWYNVSSWNKQMAQYKIILRDNYGINEKDFEQTRMIPIRAIYSDGDAKKNIFPVLLEVEIGDANVKNIQSDYLLPVGLQNEKVVIENNPEASERINKLLEKLNDIYTKLSDQKTLPSERLDKAEQLNALYSAIRQLQMRQDIRPLLYQAKVLNVQIQGIINKYNNEIKAKDQSELSNDEIEEFVKTLKIAEDALGYYTNLDTELEFLFEGSLSEEDKNLSVELRETVYSSRKLKETLSKVFTEFTVEKIGGTEQGEKIVKDVFSKWLGTTSTIQLEGMAALFKKANAAFGRAGMDTQTEVARLKELKKSFEQWAARKGLSKSNMFNMIKKKDANELIDQYQDTFYETLNHKIQTKDFAWIKDNVDVAAYQDYLNKKIETETKRIEDKPRLGTEEQNYNEVTREIFEAKNLYDISTPQSVGWLLYNDIKKFPKDKWETNEWKDLHKKENEAALNFYNYIIERNEEYAKTGYIPAGNARVFLPWVRKGLMEKLAMGGKITMGEQFLKNISVDEEEIGFGKFDPINGKPINRLPKYLTSKFEEQYSEDLFKTMAMYNEFAIKFQYLASIENQALALLRLEENKQAIATSKFARTSIKNGEIQYTNNNDENSKLLEDMIKAIVYQQKYIESESYDQLLGKFGNFGKTINDKLGFKMLPENLDGRQISINKAITHMNNTFQVTSLGLNILSASSNYFGGTAQGLINAGKYFTKAEYAASEAWLLSFKMAGNLDKQKVLAALDYFIPFTDNYNRRAATQLSLNKLNDEAIQDFLMSLMRNGDEAVQTVNFVSFLKNSIIVDGKVVNSREYLKTTDEYKDFYQGTQSERDARADKFEKDVKAINEKQGVLALSTVVNGELVIPGVERKSDSVIEVRRKVQSFTADALGSMTEENKRLMNLNIYGNSFMVFKNWIPRLVDVRFGNIKYNAASDAYEWGRTRMITRFITWNLFKSIKDLKNSLQGNDKGMEFIRELYEKKKADYKADTNKELKMTEAEFIDLVRGNIKNQLLDLIFYATLWAITLGLKALAPDDDEEPSVKNRWNFMLKATDKFKDEIGYFYNPGSLMSIPQKGIFPALGLLNNYEKALEGFLKETYALGTGDDELAEDTKTIKYWMKTHPITNQAAGMLPIFYPELAKDLGIRMQSQYGIR